MYYNNAVAHVLGCWQSSSDIGTNSLHVWHTCALATLCIIDAVTTLHNIDVYHTWSDPKCHHGFYTMVIMLSPRIRIHVVTYILSPCLSRVFDIMWTILGIHRHVLSTHLTHAHIHTPPRCSKCHDWPILRSALYNRKWVSMFGFLDNHCQHVRVRCAALS